MITGSSSLRVSCSRRTPARPLLGVSMCVFPTLVLSALSYVVPQRLVLVRHGKHGAITTTMRGLRVDSRARAWKELIFARRVQWVERVVSSPHHTQNYHGVDGDTKVSVSNQRQHEQQRHHADCWSSCLPDAMPRCIRGATVVLLEYAAAWYACADVTLLTVASVLGAVSTFESAAACRASAISVLALYAVQLVLCVVVQPFTTMFSHVYTIFTLLLSVVAVCQVW
ncbi:GPI-anchored surface protein, putative [Bodo saltans]|uniref:GPI-anchored surface protein, putative n=1 Tax=Bodo saltans TaxID=75058 RepID=A0A0S4J7L7_BODSA|nr:GPI-anchored surface protein, putative [Bodo saltans]|eukprot:CUG85943.1 GPI-anchored surface protein, putative [Bodo saltans]